MKELREQLREKLSHMAGDLEAMIAEAQRPETPAHKEFAVRQGRRAIDGLAKRVRELEKMGDPEPWVTAPTKERTAQAGEPPRFRIVAGDGQQPEGVNHRWVWPVERLQ